MKYFQLKSAFNSAEPDSTKDEEKEQSSEASSSAQFYQNQPFKCLANSIEPRMLLQVINERLESHKKVDVNASTIASSSVVAGGGGETGEETTGENPSSASAGNNCGLRGGESGQNSRVKCMPSARSINCQHHCVAILGTRLFAILCNEQAFQQKLISENREVCFNLIVDILYPNNDPVRRRIFLLCLFRSEWDCS